ncbi:MAG: flippase-like domain-containing protein [Ruminococcus sp.]|nr:flippase-like domain-containing protein [Ruminococcus sp.]
MKKIVKIAGNLLMIAAVVFLIKKFIDMDADFSQLGTPSAIAAIAVSFVVQTVIVVMGTFPWLVFTQSLSGTKIPFSAAMPVYTKSNMYKYVPGNVFQYIGRNQLAADMDISHVDVACATIFDVLFCVLSTGVISLILLGGAIVDLMEKYGRNLLIIGAAGVLILAAAAVLVRLKFREKVSGYLSRYKKAFEKGKRGKLLQGVGYYFLQNCVSAAMYFVTLNLIFGDSAGASELISLTGAFMFAWIVGFVTPGAPGGIGIRESVMLFVCGAAYEEKVLLFVLVLRISSILADAAAFMVGSIYLKLHKKK